METMAWLASSSLIFRMGCWLLQWSARLATMMEMPLKMACSRNSSAPPPLLALIAALLMNALDLRPMPIATSVLHSIGKLTIPLMLLALGASFRITKINPFLLAVAIILRMVLGLALGVWLASLFGLEGLDRAIVVLSASAPAGFSTISLASIEELDHEFAATLVASSMIVAMILIPVLLTIL